MNKVKVIDAICGAGKSTQVMEDIRLSKGKRWIYVSPYLDEVGDGKTRGRIHEAVPDKNFQCPESSGGKGNNLKKLLTEGENVSITHSLLRLMDVDSLMSIKVNKYHLVIDETLDVISVYRGVHNHDIKGLVGSWIIKDESTGRLRWNYELHGDNYRGHFKEIKDLCDLGSLYLHKDTVLINRLSPEVIKTAESVTVLTYMFEGSFMCKWLEMAGIPWEKVELKSPIDPEVIKENVRENLTIARTPKSILKYNYDSNDVRNDYAYSSTWYKRHGDTLDDVKRGCQSFLTKLRRDKVKPKTFWTTFKDYKDMLAGEGYTRGTIVTEDGERTDPFVAKNRRATNSHAECNACMYLVNVYAHGDISSYLEAQGITIDNDSLAVSEMIQFIFRGSIRKGEPMHLMVASERMKELLIHWLESPE